ncbi:YdcF family protein [Pacificibacter sp. AS14]|uniref:YdcF family protein n=1 Tax=Pacificibacter sp. AS14 TaxID=3135785 RepID=UPI0031724309
MFIVLEVGGLNVTDYLENAERLWSFHCVFDELVPSDVIVGLGSYDLRVASRCVDLFGRGLAKKMVFSGASGNWTKDLYAATEAEAFELHAKEMGVPEEAILLEPSATNIGENMRFCARIVPDAASVIIVTKPQTQLRALATAKAQWQGVCVSVTAPEVSFLDQQLPHHDERALICEMVGDFARMEDYARKGFQTEVDVPPETQAAFSALVAAGYVDHLPKQTSCS